MIVQSINQCPVCQRTLVPIWREGPAHAARCSQCGLIQSASDSTVEFEENYFSWTLSVPEVARVRIEHFKQVIRSLPIPLAAPLLDMGAGVGFFWHAMPREIAASAVLVERSIYARQVLEKQTSARVFAEPAALLAETARTFATITLWDVLAHVSEPVPFLRQLRELLAEEGHLIIKTPHHPVQLFRAAHLLGPVKKGHSLLHIPSMIYHFTPENIQPLMAAAGFIVESWQWTMEPPLHTVRHSAAIKSWLMRLGRRIAINHDSFIIVAKPTHDDT